MTNFASSLKAEITRVARKEMRAELIAMKKTITLHRAEIAALKRRLHTSERTMRRLARALPTRAFPIPSDNGELPSKVPRFSAKGLFTQRKRLGLSAADCGLLVGASGLSIYKWEGGKASPRAKFLAAIAGLRKLGKKDAVARLQALRPADQAV